MTGKEVREILLSKKYVLADIADSLGISAQTFNSRLNAKYFKDEYVVELEKMLGISVNKSTLLDSSQPILDIRVSAGHGVGLEGSENLVLEWVNIPKFEGCYGITVYGDSMYDKYKSGDIIFVRKIEGRNDFDFGQCYVLITREDRYIKNVYESTRGDNYVSMVSYNTEINPDGRRKYPDRDISKSDILFLYKVAGKLRRSQI